MNVFNLFECAVRSVPHHPALIAGVGRKKISLTYAELAQKVDTAAECLRDSGLQPGDRVLLAVPFSAETYVAMLAILKAGMVVTFIDPGHRTSQIACILRNYPPDAIIATRAVLWIARIFPELRRVPLRFVVRGKARGAISLCRHKPISTAAPTINRSAADSALLTFTSGSTGQPKALLRTHGFLKTQLEMLRQVAEVEHDDVDFVAMPMFVLFNLANRITSVIPACDMKHPGRANSRTILAQLGCSGATRMVASPALLERLADHCLQTGQSMPNLRCIATGGGPVGPTLPQRLRAVAPAAVVRTVYGSTEAEPIAFVNADKVSIADRSRTREGAGLLVGKPVRGCAVRILNASPGRIHGVMSTEAFANLCLPVGEIGEIAVSGKHVLTSYVDRARNRETKITVENTIWHCTGDAGYFDQSGRLWLVGRSAAAIKDFRGTVYPFQVEYAVSAVRGVRRAAMVARNGERVLVLETSATEFRANCVQAARCVAAFEIDRIVTVNRIPVDRRHNSKVDYRALDRLLDGQGRRLRMTLLDFISGLYRCIRNLLRPFHSGAPNESLQKH